MKIVTQKENAKTAASRMRHQQLGFMENRIPRIGERPWEVKYNAMVSIENITPQDVNRITGNDHLTIVRCDNCGIIVDGAAEFEASDWPILICHDCLIDAANKLILEISK